MPINDKRMLQIVRGFSHVIVDAMCLEEEKAERLLLPFMEKYLIAFNEVIEAERAGLTDKLREMQNDIVYYAMEYVNADFDTDQDAKNVYHRLEEACDRYRLETQEK